MDLSWVLQTDQNVAKPSRRGKILKMRGQQDQKQINEKEPSKSPAVKVASMLIYHDLGGWQSSVVVHCGLQLLPGPAMKVPATCVRAALKDKSHLLGVWKAPPLRLPWNLRLKNIIIDQLPPSSQHWHSHLNFSQVTCLPGHSSPVFPFVLIYTTVY